MFCTNCGNNFGGKFCPECGTKAGEIPSPPMPPPFSVANHTTQPPQFDVKRLLRVFGTICLILGSLIAFIRGFLEYARVYDRTIQLFRSGATRMADERAWLAVENILFSIVVIALLSIFLGVGLHIAGRELADGRGRAQKAVIYADCVLNAGLLSLVTFWSDRLIFILGFCMLIFTLLAIRNASLVNKHENSKKIKLPPEYARGLGIGIVSFFLSILLSIVLAGLVG